jgi:imidazolonepropionase-like amidohydrolase
MTDAKLFTDVMIFDGTGSPSFPGEVLVEGNRIRKVAEGFGQIDRIGKQLELIDGAGGTLMPGMVEGHGHITFTNIDDLRKLGQTPPEEHMLQTVYNAHKMLDAGFTSIYSAASAKPRLEIALRNEINAGRLTGPRLRAASPEICSTGALGDERQLHLYHTGTELIADGVDQMRVAVRTLAREGVDTIKLNISGENSVRRLQGKDCTYTEDEVKAAADEAHARGVWLSCHARADYSVRLALKNNFRCIYHCDYAEGETLDLLQAAKDRIFLAPAIGAVYTVAYEAEPWGITKEVATKLDSYRMLELSSALYAELRKRGLRVCIGGDYGFAWNPIGTNARDLEHFVNLYGYSPHEALRAATEYGGQIMAMDDLGLIKEGFLADMLLVDGDPTTDIKLMQDKNKLLMIMKDGSYHKAPGKGTVESRFRRTT